MARTVNSIGVVPRVQSYSGTEVKASGQHKIASAVNTAYVHHRHALWVQGSSQYQNAPGLPAAVSQLARVRCKTSPFAGVIQTVIAKVRIYTEGAGGSALVRCGQVSFTSSNITVTTTGITEAECEFSVTDSTNTIDLYCSIVSSTFTAIKVISVSMRYKSESISALPAGVGSDDFVPLDLSAFVTDRPVSAARSLDLCNDLRRIQRRGQQCLSVTGLDNRLSDFFIDPLFFYLPRPKEDRAGLTRALTIAAYSTINTEQTIIVDGISQLFSMSAGAFSEISFSLPGNFDISFSQLTFPGFDELESICAWWEDAEE